MDKIWSAILSVDLGSLTLGGLLWGAILSLWDRTGGEWLRARSQESGRISARDVQLDKLDKEMATLTKTAEQIKSDISNNVWTRQAAWTMKRDSYKDLILVASELEMAAGDELRLSKYIPDFGEQHEHDERQTAASKRTADVWQQLHRSVAIARLVLDSSAVEAIRASLPTFGHHDAALDSIVAFRAALVPQAHRELFGEPAPTESN